MKTQNHNNAFIYYAVFLLASIVVTAQDVSETGTKTFQVSFVYPVSSNGLQGAQISNKVSLNIIAGHTGGVEAFELGGLYNVTRNNIRGAQISGFGNTTGGEVNGFQLAGFINTNKGSVNGGQIAGFLNLVNGEVDGLQIGGFSNISESNKGFQLAGFNNRNKGTDGLQVAGFINNSKDVKGAQVSGFSNIAKTLSGVQISIINISDSVASGTQIGLINVTKKGGFISPGIESDDVIPYRIAFRSGMDHFYTVLTAGIKVDDYWSFGAGFGSRLFLSEERSTFINPEVRWHNLHEGRIDGDLDNHLVKLNLNFGYQVFNHLYVTAGPSVNFYFTNDLDEFGQPALDLVNNPSVDSQNTNRSYQVWVGYTVGIGF